MKIAFTGNTLPFGEGLSYGGERMLYYLLREAAKLGHEIYLFAREGCQIPPQYIKDYVPVGPLADTDIHYEAVKAYEARTGITFDFYQCNYFGEGWDPSILSKYPYAELTWCAWCHIHHQLRQPPFNTISCSKVLQQDFLDIGAPTQMIHYGIPEDFYQFEPKHKGYAVWIGKIEGGKAPRLAIELAKAAGLKIIMMGPPYSPDCFREEVLPYIDNRTVFWARGVDDHMKQQIMSKAKVFISSNSNVWKEHFGIVNIEALSMGVPIIAFNRIGQDCAIKVDSIIRDGEHGFFLDYHDSNNLQEILDKGVPLLQKIDQIDRLKCREQFETRFTSKIMARRFDWFWKEILSGRRFYEARTIDA